MAQPPDGGGWVSPGALDAAARVAARWLEGRGLEVYPRREAPAAEDPAEVRAVIGAALNVSRERVAQIETQAVEKLRTYARHRLGREPEDWSEVAGLFARAPDAAGVLSAWIENHPRGRPRGKVKPPPD